MNDFTDDKPLRSGWTTGACAIAAAKAACMALFGEKFPEQVTITLPRGETPSFTLALAEQGDGWARAGVVKDAREVAGLLRRLGIRVEADLRNEKIGYKIREHSQAKVPLLLIAGKREAEQRTISVRRLGGESSETLALESLLSVLPEQARPPC